jgi:hypothetical protein
MATADQIRLLKAQEFRDRAALESTLSEMENSGQLRLVKMLRKLVEMPTGKRRQIIEELKVLAEKIP